ncbi:heme exporter protein CcmD [Asaia astilbis]|uniref:heme exporter protein CcmD n=1 Tax=Asaia astilbis TaxID=610244 RepID=UPI000AF54C3D|nr:heme exporter protein CcmD [Asaia astilbis]
MSHLPYIVASYIAVLGAAGILAFQLALRLRRARTRIAALETRSARQKDTL